MHCNIVIVLNADQIQTCCITMKTSFILPIIISRVCFNQITYILEGTNRAQSKKVSRTIMTFRWAKEMFLITAAIFSNILPIIMIFLHTRSSTNWFWFSERYCLKMKANTYISPLYLFFKKEKKTFLLCTA